MHRIARSLVPALSLLALLAAPACGDREAPTGLDPSTTAVAPAFNQSGAALRLDRLATFKQRPSLKVTWATKRIGPEGGRLELQGFAIQVPAGAVDRVTMFAITLPADPDGSGRVVAEFSPHNQRFAKPVTIEFPYRGTSLEASPARTIVWWNDGWVNMGAAVTSDGAKLKTQTNHFSTYGTTSDTAERGIVTTSGG